MSPGAPALTHPDRVLFRGDGITKAMLAGYYARVASRLLAHLDDRPLTLVRVAGAARFVQKHPRGAAPPGLEIVTLDVGTGPADYYVCRDARGLASLAQLAAVELHTWGARAAAPRRPDRLTFDLDPDPALPWRAVADAALEVRERLRALGLASWCKTSGGRGLHVVVPLGRGDADWDEALAFARAITGACTRASPSTFVDKPGAQRRRGRIFLDYLRNGRAATTVSAWSPRLRRGAPVSMPLAWRELDGAEDLRGARFALREAPWGTRTRREPWTRYTATLQSLPSVTA